MAVICEGKDCNRVHRRASGVAGDAVFLTFLWLIILKLYSLFVWFSGPRFYFTIKKREIKIK